MAQETHDLQAYGQLQCCELKHPNQLERILPFIHKMCSETPCNLSNCPANAYLLPHERKLINQTNDQHSPILLSKTPDGIVFHIGPRIIAGMHGKSFYEPQCQDPVKVFSIVERPASTTSPFHLVFHNDPCGVHQISRHSLTRHIRHQLMALKAPCPKGSPCVLFDSPNIGTLSTRVIKGPEVHALKLNFLELVSTMAAQGAAVYNKTVRLNPDFSKLLMLKNAQGHIRCDRCADGIVGYRVREHNQKKTFVFVANSDDFHATAPSHPSTSALQVMKLDYADTSDEGARIVVEPESDGEDEEDEEEPYTVSLHMSVQEILNSIEHHFRTDNLKHSGCHLFPAYCDLLDEQQARRQEHALSAAFTKLGGLSG